MSGPESSQSESSSPSEQYQLVEQRLDRLPVSVKKQLESLIDKGIHDFAAYAGVGDQPKDLPESWREDIDGLTFEDVVEVLAEKITKSDDYLPSPAEGASRISRRSYIEKASIVCDGIVALAGESFKRGEVVDRNALATTTSSAQTAHVPMTTQPVSSSSTTAKASAPPAPPKSTQSPTAANTPTPPNTPSPQLNTPNAPQPPTRRNNKMARNLKSAPETQAEKDARYDEQAQGLYDLLHSSPDAIELFRKGLRDDAEGALGRTKTGKQKSIDMEIDDVKDKKVVDKFILSRLEQHDNVLLGGSSDQIELANAFLEVATIAHARSSAIREDSTVTLAGTRGSKGRHAETHDNFQIALRLQELMANDGEVEGNSANSRTDEEIRRARLETVLGLGDPKNPDALGAIGDMEDMRNKFRKSRAKGLYDVSYDNGDLKFEERKGVRGWARRTMGSRWSKWSQEGAKGVAKKMAFGFAFGGVLVGGTVAAAGGVAAGAVAGAVVTAKAIKYGAMQSFQKGADNLKLDAQHEERKDELRKTQSQLDRGIQNGDAIDETALLHDERERIDKAHSKKFRWQMGSAALAGVGMGWVSGLFEGVHDMYSGADSGKDGASIKLFPGVNAEDGGVSTDVPDLPNDDWFYDFNRDDAAPEIGSAPDAPEVSGADALQAQLDDLQSQLDDLDETNDALAAENAELRELLEENDIDAPESSVTDMGSGGGAGFDHIQRPGIEDNLNGGTVLPETTDPSELQPGDEGFVGPVAPEAEPVDTVDAESESTVVEKNDIKGNWVSGAYESAGLTYEQMIEHGDNAVKAGHLMEVHQADGSFYYQPTLRGIQEYGLVGDPTSTENVVKVLAAHSKGALEIAA